MVSSERYYFGKAKADQVRGSGGLFVPPELASGARRMSKPKRGVIRPVPLEGGPRPDRLRCCRPCLRTGCASPALRTCPVIAAIRPVRWTVNLRLESVQYRAYDRRAGCIQSFLGPPYFIEIGFSGADDQKNRINHARKVQRIIHRQNRRRVQKYDAECLRNRPERGSRLRPIDGSERCCRFPSPGHEVDSAGPWRICQHRDRMNGFGGFGLAQEDFDEAYGVGASDCRSQ